MSDKVINLAKMLGSSADAFGFKIGEKMPEVIDAFLHWLVRRGLLDENFEELMPGLHNGVALVVEFLGNVGEVPRKKIPIEGFIGDLLYEAINEALDAVGRGAKKSHDKSGDKAADKVPATPGHDPSKIKCYFANGQYHRAGSCSLTPRPAPRHKGEEKVPDVELGVAMKTRAPLSYDGCWGTPQETDKLMSEMRASLDPHPNEEKPKADGNSAPKSEARKESKGPSLFAHWERFEQDHPDLYPAADAAYEAASDTVKSKFVQAFHGHDNYDLFRGLVRKPPAKWDRLLDMILDPPKAAEEKKKGPLAQLKDLAKKIFGDTGSREREETDRAINAFGAKLDEAKGGISGWLERFDGWCKKRQSARKSHRGGKKHGFDRFVFSVFLPAIVIIAVIWALYEFGHLLPH